MDRFIRHTIMVLIAGLALLYTPENAAATGNQTDFCRDLAVTKGNYSQAPTSVMLSTYLYENVEVQKYRYHVGDGQTVETDAKQIEYHYETSGDYKARVEVQDKSGTWHQSTTCQTTVHLRTSPFESHKSACSSIDILSGQNLTAPQTAKIRVHGYDNKGNIQGYKIEYGTGVASESASATFSINFPKAGSYILKGFVKDSKGEWKGGSDTCQTTLYLTEDKPMTTQPTTGTPAILALIGGGSGILGSGLLMLRKR